MSHAASIRSENVDNPEYLFSVVDEEARLMNVRVLVGAKPAGDSRSVRTDWTYVEAESLYSLPSDLLFQAQSVHRDHFDANRIPIGQAPSPPAYAGEVSNRLCAKLLVGQTCMLR